MMKLFVTLILIGLMNSCNAQNDNKVLEIIYEAYTRGNSIEIKANSNQLFYKTYDLETSISLNKSEWNSLTLKCSEIELETLKDFLAPSENRARDLAMHATLRIITDKDTYQSQTFDHGNPPIELKMLVNELFKLAKIED